MVIIRVLGCAISGPNRTVQASLILILLVLAFGKGKGDRCWYGCNKRDRQGGDLIAFPRGSVSFLSRAWPALPQVAEGTTSRCCVFALQTYIFRVIYYVRARMYLGL
jgi:hypothetical protein